MLTLLSSLSHCHCCPHRNGHNCRHHRRHLVVFAIIVVVGRPPLSLPSPSIQEVGCCILIDALMIVALVIIVLILSSLLSLAGWLLCNWGDEHHYHCHHHG